jgi:hypothetical protein
MSSTGTLTSIYGGTPASNTPLVNPMVTYATISTIAGDWTLVIEVFGVDASVTSVTLQLETTTDGFSVVHPAFVVSLDGPLSASGTGPFNSPRRFSARKEDIPGLPFGTANGIIRTNVTELAGSGNVTFQAFIETP